MKLTRTAPELTSFVSRNGEQNIELTPQGKKVIAHLAQAMKETFDAAPGRGKQATRLSALPKPETKDNQSPKIAQLIAEMQARYAVK